MYINAQAIPVLKRYGNPFLTFNKWNIFKLNQNCKIQESKMPVIYSGLR